VISVIGPGLEDRDFFQKWDALWFLRGLVHCIDLSALKNGQMRVEKCDSRIAHNKGGLFASQGSYRPPYNAATSLLLRWKSYATSHSQAKSGRTMHGAENVCYRQCLGLTEIGRCVSCSDRINFHLSDLLTRLHRGTIRETATYSSLFACSYIFCTVLQMKALKCQL
jgi:hypothetical protein